MFLLGANGMQELFDFEDIRVEFGLAIEDIKQHALSGGHARHRVTAFFSCSILRDVRAQSSRRKSRRRLLMLWGWWLLWLLLWLGCTKLRLEMMGQELNRAQVDPCSLLF